MNQVSNRFLISTLLQIHTFLVVEEAKQQALAHMDNHINLVVAMKYMSNQDYLHRDSYHRQYRHQQALK